MRSSSSARANTTVGRHRCSRPDSTTPSTCTTSTSLRGSSPSAAGSRGMLSPRRRPARTTSSRTACPLTRSCRSGPATTRCRASAPWGPRSSGTVGTVPFSSPTPGTAYAPRTMARDSGIDAQTSPERSGPAVRSRSTEPALHRARDARLHLLPDLRQRQRALDRGRLSRPGSLPRGRNRAGPRRRQGQLTSGEPSCAVPSFGSPRPPPCWSWPRSRCRPPAP